MTQAKASANQRRVFLWWVLIWTLLPDTRTANEHKRNSYTRIRVLVKPFPTPQIFQIPPFFNFHCRLYYPKFETLFGTKFYDEKHLVKLIYFQDGITIGLKSRKLVNNYGFVLEYRQVDCPPGYEFDGASCVAVFEPASPYPSGLGWKGNFLHYFFCRNLFARFLLLRKSKKGSQTDFRMHMPQSRRRAPTLSVRFSKFWKC